MPSVYKGTRSLIPLAAVTAVTRTEMENGKGNCGINAKLTQNVKFMLDKLMTLKKRGPTQSGIDDLQTLPGSQNSGVITSDNLPLTAQGR